MRPSLNTNKNNSDDGLLSPAPAVGDAGHWDCPLTPHSRGGGDRSPTRTPVPDRLYVQHARRSGVLLTNLLAHASITKTRPTSSIVSTRWTPARPSLAERRGSVFYFYVFFHRPYSSDQPLGLRAVLRESGGLAKSVGDSLKAQVVRGKLRHSWRCGLLTIQSA